MKKCFVYDLDDTLLNNQGELSEKTIEALKSLRELGFLNVINSARSLYRVKHFKDDFSFDYYITDGGALIFDQDFNEIYRNLMDKELVNKVLTKMKKDGIAKKFAIQGEARLYSEDLDYARKRDEVEGFDDLLELNIDTSKIIMECTDYPYLKRISDSFGLKFTNYFHSEWSRFSLTTKSFGNKVLNQLKGPFEFICFGDDYGDIEMLLEAKMGICMANSTKEVLKVIENVTEFTNDEDGVANYITDHFLR